MIQSNKQMDIPDPHILKSLFLCNFKTSFGKHPFALPQYDRSGAAGRTSQWKEIEIVEGIG